ncbi:MAG: DUF885 domain-containing protein [Pseudomonadota bacterium]
MQRTAKYLGVSLLGMTLVLATASVWFWYRPVGLNNYINKATIALALPSPELLTSLGLIDNTPLDFHSGKLGDYTEAGDRETLQRLQRLRAGLDRYGPEGLEGQELISWRVTAWFMDNQIRLAGLSRGGYAIGGGATVNQLSGVTIDMPQLLSDQHVIKNEKSVQRYLSRLREYGRVLGEVRARVASDRSKGFVPPDFIIEKTLLSMRTFTEGGAANNALVTTLAPKLEALEHITSEQRTAYLEEAQTLVASEVLPGFEALISLHEEMIPEAGHDAGLWRLPDGEQLYKAALASNTTTDISADEIHKLGLSEVARLRVMIEDILAELGLTTGSMEERITRLTEDPTHLFANTEQGRAEILAYLEELNKEVIGVAGDYFMTLPHQPVDIVRVPAYAQDSSAFGYYRSPALDGSRAGRFYINLKDTAEAPRWTLPSLLYHEAAPGHHFQISSAQLIEDVPLLRQAINFNAYAEGWALYAEWLAANDMGLYDDDPLGRLGQLQYQIYRAVRLVVDTGLHAKRWTREQAIDYMIANTGTTEAEVTREIERYVVWPGQATGYMIGQLTIQRIRQAAENTLQDRFDLRAFHEALLSNGALPLGLLEDVMAEWIAEQAQVSPG